MDPRRFSDFGTSFLDKAPHLVGQFLAPAQPLINSSLKRCARNLFIVILTLAPALAFTPLTSDATAQVILRNREDDKNQEAEIERLMKDSLIQKEQSVFMPAPREILRPLFQADRAIKENDMTRAVSLLGEVLSNSTQDDYLVPVPGQEGLSMSLRMRAQRVLGSLPEKDRELYRLKYGVQAKQLLERAIEKSDFESVSRVMQRFFFTDAGFDAAMLLGHHHLDEGRPIAAANCFNRITSSREGRAIHDPEVSVLLATCWMLGDSPDRATKALTELKRRTDPNTIEFMGRRIRLFEQPDQATEWLTNLIGNTPLKNVEFVNLWVMNGGNPQRNARSGTGFPLISPRWSVPIMNEPDLENSASSRLKELIHLQSAPVPSVQPLAVGDTIVMRSFDQMIGVDFQTGKRLWVYPPPDFTTKIPGAPIKPRKMSVTPMTERLWMDSIYGQACSDGQRIFVVPQPGFSDKATRMASKKSDKILHRTMNELKAIDIERQSAHLWEVGGVTGLDEPKLAKSFFLGAPLIVGKELYVVAQRESEIVLYVLDSETGRLNWEQMLGTTETSLAINKDRHRRLAGATPSFSNGILVCSTGTGALVGVDVSSRSLLWGYQYTSPGKKQVQPISINRKSNSDPLSGLWRDSTITIAQGRVIFTPIDSQDLICVDLQNGFPVWDSVGGKTAKSPRGESLFVACVENNNAILVGETNVRAVSLRNGETDWIIELEELGRPSGRGYANRGYYFFPTTAKKMVQVNLNLGSIVKTTDTGSVLGNLVCYRGEVISHGVDRLRTFPQDEPNQILVNMAEESGTMTPKLLAIKSQLQLQAGFKEDALDSIEAAYKESPNQSFGSLLQDLLLQLMREDFKVGSKRAEPYKEQLLSDRKYEYLAAKVDGLIEIGQPNEALEILLGLVDPVTDLSQVQSEYILFAGSSLDKKTPPNLGKKQTVSSNKIRLDTWVTSQIEFILTKLEFKEKQTLVKKLNLLFAQADDLNPLERFEILRSFPIRLIAAETRIELVEQLMDQGHLLQATLIVRTLDEMDLDKLDETVQSTFLPRQLPNPPTPKWNFNSATVKEIEFKNSPGLTPHNIRLLHCDSPLYEKYQFRFFGQTGELLIRDANGQPIHRFLTRIGNEDAASDYNTFTFGRISIKDNLAVMDIGNEIVAMDLLKLKEGQNPTLWHKVISGGARDHSPYTASSAWGEIDLQEVGNSYETRVFVSPANIQTICYVDSTVVVAVDTLTGKELWRRGGILPSSILFGDARNIICWNESKRLARVFSRADGHIVSENKLAEELGTIWQAYETKVLVSTLRPASDQGNVLTAKEQGKERSKSKRKKKKPYIKMSKTLGLFDLVNNRLVWEHEYPARDEERMVRATLGCRVGQNRLAILEPNKDLKFINVQTGEVEFSTPIKISKSEADGMDGIAVLKILDRYLLHLEFSSCNSRVSVTDELEYIYINYSQKTWDGGLFCIDPNTGANLWNNYVRFTNLQLGVNHPYHSPIYVMLRKITDDSDGDRKAKTQALAVDIKTGMLVSNTTSKATSGYQAQLDFRADPSGQKMEMLYDESRVVFQFGIEKHLPPAPLAHLRVKNTLPKEFRETATQNLDAKLLALEKEKQLKRAVEAQKLLPQRRAEEKRRLELEKSGSF